MDNKIICKCGAKLKIDRSARLLSNPPKYRVSCNECGRHGFTYCYQIYKEEADNEV